ADRCGIPGPRRVFTRADPLHDRIPSEPPAARFHVDDELPLLRLGLVHQAAVLPSRPVPTFLPARLAVAAGRGVPAALPRESPFLSARLVALCRQVTLSVLFLFF